MPRPPNGELTDEAVHLVQRGLYVEPLKHPLNMNKFPSDGNEYIHWVRQEHASYFPEETKDLPIFVDTPIQTKKVSSQSDISEWKSLEAYKFSHLAIQLKLRRDQLIKKFPRKTFPSIDNEKDCCLFCLGSEMYGKIFEDENIENMKDHSPLLSIVLHLSQEDIFSVLQYLRNWSNVIGMNDIICRWMYALLACVKKPLSEDREKYLERFYDACLRKIKTCEESQGKQLYLISAILYSYFCIKAYQVGPPLSRFHEHILMNSDSEY